MTLEEIHKEALKCASDYKKQEVKLIEILQVVNQQRVYLKLGFASLFSYCVDALKLPANQVYILNGIAKKAEEVPELKTAIATGAVSISNARRLVPVVTKENRATWIEKAKALPQLELEREIRKEFPLQRKAESLRVATATSSYLSLMVSKETHDDIKRLQDVLSSKMRKNCTIEETITFSIQRSKLALDPLERAKRRMAREASENGRLPSIKNAKKDSEKNFILQMQRSSDLSQRIRSRHIPVAIQANVVLKDNGECGYRLPTGRKCGSKRWLHRHHKKEFSRGGAHTERNLELLCATHHRIVHQCL